MLGVELDANRKEVTFSLNGRVITGYDKVLKGADKWSFCVCVYNPNDAVELVPSMCWSKA